MSHPYKNSHSCTLVLSCISRELWTIAFLFTLWWSPEIVLHGYFVPLYSIFHKTFSGHSHPKVYRNSTLAHFCAPTASMHTVFILPFTVYLTGEFACLLCLRKYELLEDIRNVFFNSESPGLSSVLICRGH